jgi:hypothetical protein
MIKTNKKWATRIFQSIAARLRNVVNIEREITHNIFFSVTVILLLFVIVFNYPPQLRKRMSFDANIRQLLPVKAVNYMIDNKITGRLFNYYSWGGYIIFRTYPEKVIFIDGSLNYPTAIFNDYITTVMTGNWKDCFEKYQIDMVLLPVDLPLTRILINNIEWISLFEDENSILLKNKRFKPV